MPCHTIISPSYLCPTPSPGKLNLPQDPVGGGIIDHNSTAKVVSPNVGCQPVIWVGRKE